MVSYDATVQMIDTSIVHAACIARNRSQSMDRLRGGLTSKIYALVDTHSDVDYPQFARLNCGTVRS
jgi:hypothetical protein